MQFKQPGPWLFAVGMVALGLAVLALAWLPSRPMAPGVWMIPPIVLVLAGAGLLVRRTSAVSGVVLVVYWLAWMVLDHVPDLIAEPGAFHLWVSAAKALTFATVAAAFVRARLWPVARMVFGATLLLFGAVHTFFPGVVADLLPDWFPIPGVWPYLSGGVQIAAGLMILLGFRAPAAAFAIGLMWLSWVPLVHLPRLISAPDALFEWTFMITALALAGAAWSVGERIAPRSGEDLQPSVR